MFNIPHDFVEVTHFCIMKSCFSILLFHRGERTQQLNKGISICWCPRVHLMSSPFPEIHAKSLILLFWHCPMTICVINFKQGMSADALSLIANLKLLPPAQSFRSSVQLQVPSTHMDTENVLIPPCYKHDCLIMKGCRRSIRGEPLDF